jgi:probable phosphoglycerate mutase
MIQKEILLIRHGETDWNAERRLQGHLDIALNVQGVRQADALGRALRGVELDAVFASDLRRALQTAQAVAGPKGMAVKIDPALRERCYGAFEGLRHADIQLRYPQHYAAWQARDADARFPKGEREAETLREFTERAVGAIMRLVATADCRRMAIVTHGGVLECIYRAVNRVSSSAPRDFEIRNASINRMTWDGAVLRITAWSDIAHLSEAVLDEVDR